MRYRKKPVVIEAVQFDGTVEMAIRFRDLYGDALLTDPDTGCFLGGLIIHTLEGDHIASKDDFIITSVKGERYPCKPDIFGMTYEAAD